MRRGEPSGVLITGASGAIGGALARAYAAPGRSLILQGRDGKRLEGVAGDCARAGAEVEAERRDLADVDGARAWLEDVFTRHDPDLVVLNAGMNTSAADGDGQLEPWERASALLGLNLLAVAGLADVAARRMAARGSGHIALMSSLAAWVGLPVTPAYSASKAGVKAYGEALHGALARRGVEVSVILPGYVRSPMCDAMPGPKAFLLTPEEAAVRIRRGLDRGRARIAFPWPLALGTRLLSMLPAVPAARILAALGYRA
jgi:short-subunit dehydrogenase